MITQDLNKQDKLTFLMILAAACDAEFHPKETHRIYEIIKNYPMFKDKINLERVKEIAEMIINLDNFDAFGSIQEISKELSYAERKMTFCFALSIIDADGKIKNRELDFIRKLSTAFDIDDEEFKKLTYALSVSFGVNSLEELK